MELILNQSRITTLDVKRSQIYTKLDARVQEKFNSVGIFNRCKTCLFRNRHIIYVWACWNLFLESKIISVGWNSQKG